MADGSDKSVQNKSRPWRPRSGDWKQEGANNTVISLGTDRVASGPATVDDVNKTNPGSGAVHIIAGRKDPARNPDLNADDASLYLSQNTDADKTLGLTSIITGYDNAPAAVIKSDNVRAVYRKSTKIASDDAKNYMYFDKEKIEIRVGEKTRITIVGEAVLIQVDNSAVVVNEKKIVVQAGTIELGYASESGNEGIILGASFTQFFDSHIHMTPMGPSQPPTPMMNTLASELISDQSFVRLGRG